MRFLTKTKKAALAVILVLELSAATALPAAAISIPSPSDVASQLENRYHLNLGSIQNAGESFNTSGDKQPTPQVSLFFSPSDPRPGEKITANAFPMYFSNKAESLYYTWYLKRAGCDLDKSPSDAAKKLCDQNGDDKVSIEDWKIAATKLIAQNGYDNANASDQDTDNDGYQATFGGDGNVNVPAHCYFHDAASGVNYEFAKSGAPTNFTCPPDKPKAVCLEQDTTITGGGLGGFGQGVGSCTLSGYPTCSVTTILGVFGAVSGTPHCDVGIPKCIADPTNIICPDPFDTADPIAACSATPQVNAAPYCNHLFPNGDKSGDGRFGLSEEQFWGTDPSDPSTANNGNKDEANVVGLGQKSFTWNYAAGDQVGVAVEGNAMIPTKYDDASQMVMWAFSKNRCDMKAYNHGIGALSQSIRGYNVSIPTVDLDLNDCLSDNLVDPTQGGQSSNLDVTVTASPDNPVNDGSADKSGDTVTAQAIISNGNGAAGNQRFDWKVEVGDSVEFTHRVDVTKELQNLGLLGDTKGNALGTLKLKLDIPENTPFQGGALKGYLSGGTGYLRFTANVQENFSSGVVRKGKSDVIVKFVSTGKKIVAYSAAADTTGTNVVKVTLPGESGKICDKDPLDRSVCRVVKNEIVGLQVDKTGLSDFSWTINGVPLECSKTGVSSDCADGSQNNVNFFPVTGNPGDTYTVTLQANNVETGNAVTLSRTFNVVQPTVAIKTMDRSVVWPKFLGQYIDITGKADQGDCSNGYCGDYSDRVLQTGSGNPVELQAVFSPGFLADQAVREWRVDGVVQGEDSPGRISFYATKPPSSFYDVTLAVSVTQTTDLRRALSDVWGVSQTDTPETRFAVSNQIEVLDQSYTVGPFQGPRKYFAALASYLPASVLFTFRILLSGALILFVTGLMFSILPERVFADRRTEE